MRTVEIRHRKRPTLDEVLHAAAVVLGTILYAAAAWAFMNAPCLHAEAEQRMAAEVEAESRDSCRRLGMPPGGDRYAACAVELSRVRQQHEDRAARRSAGLL